MEGIDCPNCGEPSEWLSTTNKWEYYCPRCKIRFSRHGEVYKSEE